MTLPEVWRVAEWFLLLLSLYATVLMAAMFANPEYVGDRMWLRMLVCGSG
jgi:hypothetical protein